MKIVRDYYIGVKLKRLEFLALLVEKLCLMQKSTDIGVTKEQIRIQPNGPKKQRMADCPIRSNMNA